MGYARRLRRKKKRENLIHSIRLSNLLGGFYEFLSKSPQPTDEEVKEMFTSYDNKWKRYCQSHELMNMSYLFELNVREAWTRYQKKLSQNK